MHSPYGELYHLLEFVHNNLFGSAHCVREAQDHTYLEKMIQKHGQSILICVYVGVCLCVCVCLYIWVLNLKGSLQYVMSILRYAPETLWTWIQPSNNLTCSAQSLLPTTKYPVTTTHLCLDVRDIHSCQHLGLLLCHNHWNGRHMQGSNLNDWNTTFFIPFNPACLCFPKTFLYAPLFSFCRTCWCIGSTYLPPLIYLHALYSCVILMECISMP